MLSQQLVVALRPEDEVGVASELAVHLEAQADSDALPSDRAAAESAEALLPVEDVDTITPFKFNDAVLAGFRIGYRQDAASTALHTLSAGATATQSLLQMAGWIQEMKSRLSRKEFSHFVKDLLHWVGGEARKYLDVARAFDGFDLSRLQGVEPFTLLKLRSKRYSEVIARLQESALITQQLVQELISQLIPKQQRKKRASQEHQQSSSDADAVITRHADAASGTFYYTLKAVNLSEQIGSKLEDLLESQTIGQILAQAASGPQPNEHYHAQLEELKEVVDNARELELENRQLELKLTKRESEIAARDRLIADLEAKLSERASVPTELSSEDLTGLNVGQDSEAIQGSEQGSKEHLHSVESGLEVQDAIQTTQTAEYEIETTQTTDCPELEQKPSYKEQDDKSDCLVEQEEDAQNWGAEPDAADSSNAESEKVARSLTGAVASRSAAPDSKLLPLPEQKQQSTRNLQPVEILTTAGEWIGGYFVHTCIAVGNLVNSDRQFTLFDTNGGMWRFLGRIRPPQGCLAR